GAIIALSSVTGVMLANAGWNAWLVILVMILIGALIGLASGVLIQYFDVEPFIATLAMMFLCLGLASMVSSELVRIAESSWLLIQYFDVQPIIAPLAMMFLGRGLASMLSTVPVRLEESSGILLLGEKVKIIDGPKVNDLMITPGVVIALLLVVVAFIILHRTRTGRTVYAIGGSEQSAALMGLSVVRTKLFIYVTSGTLAGIAAVVYTARLGSAQNITGIGWELDAIAAAVIGGTLLTGGFGYVL